MIFVHLNHTFGLLFLKTVGTIKKATSSGGLRTFGGSAVTISCLVSTVRCLLWPGFCFPSQLVRTLNKATAPKDTAHERNQPVLPERLSVLCFENLFVVSFLRFVSNSEVGSSRQLVTLSSDFHCLHATHRQIYGRALSTTHVCRHKICHTWHALPLSVYSYWNTSHS